ncbi:hypothetical protein GALMADRAFT_608088 [Galerina marginata CBS 339.88]|uniref:Uncharacterized protein n=1 Tax=Galerina marginata (strain CBS 339.88) TaxID=685588 RepID=A0A067STQ2_GALM3|nr:hypothetical protein GALMADRAFT_608088 [Galerina marginata CBS 339.88]
MGLVLVSTRIDMVEVESPMAIIERETKLNGVAEHKAEAGSFYARSATCWQHKRRVRRWLECRRWKTSQRDCSAQIATMRMAGEMAAVNLKRSSASTMGTTKIRSVFWRICDTLEGHLTNAPCSSSSIPFPAPNLSPHRPRSPRCSSSDIVRSLNSLLATPVSQLLPRTTDPRPTLCSPLVFFRPSSTPCICIFPASHHHDNSWSYQRCKSFPH